MGNSTGDIPSKQSCRLKPRLRKDNQTKENPDGKASNMSKHIGTPFILHRPSVKSIFSNSQPIFHHLS